MGEKFHEALLESLGLVEKFILMEYFIIQPGKMWDSIHEILKEKVAQGKMQIMVNGMNLSGTTAGILVTGL